MAETILAGARDRVRGDLRGRDKPAREASESESTRREGSREMDGLKPVIQGPTLIRCVVASLSMTILGGSFLWAKSDRSAKRSAPTVSFRTKPTMALQPRPVSAPSRHFDRPAMPVILLGIESFDEAVSEETQRDHNASGLTAEVPFRLGEWVTSDSLDQREKSVND